MKPDPQHQAALQRAAWKWGDVGGLWGRGDASVIVLGLILSGVAGAAGGPGFTRVYLQPAQIDSLAHAKLRCLGCSSGSHPAWEAAEVGRRCMMRCKEKGFGQAQHLPSSSLWGLCLRKRMVFGSLLWCQDPAVNSIKAVLGKRE